MILTLDYFSDWLERYFTAWKINQCKLLEGLFTEGAIYYSGPFKPPTTGKQTIIDGWRIRPRRIKIDLLPHRHQR